MDTRTRYKMILGHLHIIEEKYGSISKVPENDPDYIAIADLRTINGFNENEQALIIKLAEEGHSTSYIAHRVDAQTGKVKSFMSFHHIKHKRIFRYILQAPDRKVYYVDRLGHFVKFYFGKTNCASTDANLSYLKNRGFEVIEKDTIWHDIPVGHFFYLIYMNKPIVKVNDVSYVYN